MLRDVRKHQQRKFEANFRNTAHSSSSTPQQQALLTYSACMPQQEHKTRFCVSIECLS
jgi:hypothetical protein